MYLLCEFLIAFLTGHNFVLILLLMVTYYKKKSTLTSTDALPYGKTTPAANPFNTESPTVEVSNLNLFAMSCFTGFH